MLQFYSRAMSFAPLNLNLPSIATQNLPPGSVGVPYSLQLLVSGGFAPYTWSLVSGTLPTGLVLGGSGLLNGTPTTQQTNTIVLQVMDAHGHSSPPESFNIVVILSTLILAGETLPAATIGQPYTQNIAGRASGGRAPITFALVSYSPPGDVYTVSAAGVISGTPGAFTADSANVTADATITADSL